MDSETAAPAALFVNGTTGVGKTSTLQALGAVLAEAGVPHALVDLDMIALAYPPPPGDPYNTKLILANLAAIVPNYRSAGADRIAIAGVLTAVDDRDRYASALGVPELTVCRLRARPDTVERRLRERHGRDAPWELGGFLEGYVRLDAELDRAGVDDVVLDVDDLSARDVARELAAAVGWLPTR